MTRRLFTYATSLIVLAAGAAYAQTPPPQTPPAQTPPAQTSPQRDEARTVTATGCLKQEKDVPGLSSSRAERAGMGEDYVITNAKLTGAGAATADTPRGKQMAMYRVTGVDKDKLRSMLNQQVEVTGRLESVPRREPTPPPSGAPDRPGAPGQTGTQTGRAEDLQEIRGTSIKSIASSCTAGTS